MRIIRGKYGRRRFDVPKNITARPTTDFARENIFNVIENLVSPENLDVLDLFAGTGAVSFEFLSRGSASVTSVEKAATQFNFIKKVGEILGDKALKPIKGDVFRFLSSSKPSSYDIVFADPPYDLPEFEKVADAVFASGVIRPGGYFILEHSKIRDYSNREEFMERRVYGSVNFSIFRIPQINNDDKEIL